MVRILGFCLLLLTVTPSAFAAQFNTTSEEFISIFRKLAVNQDIVVPEEHSQVRIDTNSKIESVYSLGGGICMVITSDTRTDRIISLSMAGFASKGNYPKPLNVGMLGLLMFGMEDGLSVEEIKKVRTDLVLKSFDGIKQEMTIAEKVLRSGTQDGIHWLSIADKDASQSEKPEGKAFHQLIDREKIAAGKHLLVNESGFIANFNEKAEKLKQEKISRLVLVKESSQITSIHSPAKGLHFFIALDQSGKNIRSVVLEGDARSVDIFDEFIMSGALALGACMPGVSAKKFQEGVDTLGLNITKAKEGRAIWQGNGINASLTLSRLLPSE